MAPTTASASASRMTSAVTARPSAERHPQSDLARTARDHVRHQTAERAAGEQQRHAAEEGCEDRDEPLLHQGLVDAALHGFNLDRRKGPPSPVIGMLTGRTGLQSAVGPAR